MNSCGVYFYILILVPSAKGGFPLGRHNCVQWLLHNTVRQKSLTGTKQFSVADMHLWQGRCTDTWAPCRFHFPLLCFPSAIPCRSPPVLKQADRMRVIYNVLSLSIAAKWYEVNQGRSNERLRIHSCEHILSVVSVMVAAPEEARMRRAEGP